MKRYEVRWANLDPTQVAEMAKTRLTPSDASALRRLITEMYGE